MRIVLDTIDNDIYGDLILSPQEIDRMILGEMVDGTCNYKHIRVFLGVRQAGVWDYREDYDEEEEI